MGKPALAWVWTNIWAVVTALAIHSFIGELLGRDDTASILTIVIGALVIGGIIGAAQGRGLAARLAGLDRPRWIGVTIIGAALVLLVGMTTTRLGWSINFTSFEGEEATAIVERAWSAVLLTQVAGFVIGVLLGAPQAGALRAPVGLRLAWVIANGAGWSLGMLLTAVPIGFLSPELDLRWTFVALFAGLALTGASVGLFTGLVLTRLVRHSRRAATADHPSRLPLP